MVKRRQKLTPFGKAIKKRAVEKDMSLADVATAVGLSRQYLSSIMTGRRTGQKYRSKIINLLELTEKWEISA